MKRSMGKVYAVRKGHNPGIYFTWDECKRQVNGFSGAIYKSFSTKPEACKFLKHENAKADTRVPDEATLLEIFSDELGDIESTTAQNRKGHKRKADTLLQRTLKTRKVVKNAYSEIKKNGFTFSVDENNYPIVYTDGACSNNGKKSAKAKAGFGVFWGDGHPLNLSRRLEGIQTNQRAEIAAINACLEQAKAERLDNLTVKTDSQFVINCVTKWVPGWMKRNWIKSDGKAVVHQTELMKMLGLLKHVNVNWVHVRGHRGIYGNEMADQLAVAGSLL